MTESTTKEPEDKGMIRVFVYGTLKRGGANNVLLRKSGSKCLGFDTVTGAFNMYSMGGFPAVLDDILKTGEKVVNRTVHGEVWATTPEGLASLDMLEGNPNFFRRQKLWTDRLQRRAWMYFLNSNWHDELTPDDAIPGLIWRPSEEEKEFWAGKAA